jgi:hypothetical protein
VESVCPVHFHEGHDDGNTSVGDGFEVRTQVAIPGDGHDHELLFSKTEVMPISLLFGPPTTTSIRNGGSSRLVLK